MHEHARVNGLLAQRKCSYRTHVMTLIKPLFELGTNKYDWLVGMEDAVGLDQGRRLLGMINYCISILFRHIGSIA